MVFKNVDYKIFKSIIEYIYVDDINFIHEFKNADQILEMMKLAK